MTYFEGLVPRLGTSFSDRLRVRNGTDEWGPVVAVRFIGADRDTVTCPRCRSSRGNRV
jgi:hypothetical protein